jgi:hypothetical protein
MRRSSNKQMGTQWNSNGTLGSIPGEQNAIWISGSGKPYSELCISMVGQLMR